MLIQNKRLFLGIFVVITILFIGNIIAFADTNQPKSTRTAISNEKIDVGKAMANIRLFLKEQDLSPQFTGEAEKRHSELRPIFESENKYFELDPSTFEVEYYKCKTAFGTDSEENISLSEAKAIASELAKRNFSLFSSDNLVNTTEKYIDHGSFSDYRFQWNQVINGIETPNFVYIVVDAKTGVVRTYIEQDNESIKNIPQPNVTASEALKVLGWKEYEELNTNLRYWPVNGQNTLYWDVSAVFINPETEETWGVNSRVNAQTGKIIQ